MAVPILTVKKILNFLIFIFCIAVGWNIFNNKFEYTRPIPTDTESVYVIIAIISEYQSK